MTHAALQDLVKKWRDDAGAGYGYRFALTNCADELSAALSAMEGEAKPKFTTGHCENKRKPGGCPNHNLHCGYPECDRRPVERTAPPPQQAYHSKSEMKRVELLKGNDPYAHPTPSPGPQNTQQAQYTPTKHPMPAVPDSHGSLTGPQGGGDAATVRVFFNWNEHLSEHDALNYQHDFRLFEIVCEYVCKHLDATPPAHQPGDVVTDEMVERAIAFFWSEFPENERDEEWWQWARPLMRETLTAALTTSRRDGNG